MDNPTILETIQAMTQAINDLTLWMVTVKGIDFAAKSSEGDYGLSVRRAVYALWSGKLDKAGFTSQMEDTIDLGLRRAWNEGLRDVGVSPKNMTSEMELRIGQIVIEQYNYIGGFADWIIENSKANGGKLSDLQDRASLWYGRYDQTRQEAHLYKEQNYRWDLGPTEKHCETKGDTIGCSQLAGIVAPASAWRARGLHPGCNQTTCGGHRCGCSFAATDEPATEGGIPK